MPSFETEKLRPHVGRLIFRRAQLLAEERRNALRKLLLTESCGNRSGLFFKEAAERLIPDCYDRHPGIAAGIVSAAAHLVLTPEEDEAVRTRNAQARQHMAGLLSNNKNALAAQGKTLWSDAERRRLAELAGDPRFQHTSGPHSGKPVAARITSILNDEFGLERPPRTTNAVKTGLTALNRERGIQPAAWINWSIIAPELVRLAKQYRYPPDTRQGHPGNPDWIAIAAILGKRFPKEPTITPKNCSSQYASLGKRTLQQKKRPDAQ